MIWAIRDLHIASKFFLGVILVFCLALFVGLEVRNGLLDTQQGLVHVVDVSWPEQNDAREIRRRSNLVHQSLFRFVAWSSVGLNGDIVSSLANEITSGLDKVGTGLAEYIHWADLTAEERQSIAQAAKNWTIYCTSARNILDIGATDPALASVMLGGAHDEFDAVTRNLSDLNLSIYKRAGEKTKFVLERANVTQGVLLVGGAAFIGLVCLLTVIMYRLVLAPIASVTTAMSAVADGAAEAILPAAGRRDEIGQMVEAIRRFKAKVEFDRNSMSRMARHDALTGLPNRLHFGEQVEIKRSRLERSGESFTVMLLDLDRFKSVNDTFGHFTGDELLKQVADRLLNALRDGDTVCRLGGDEFAILLSEPCSADIISKVASRIGDVIKAPYEIQGQPVTVGTSIGIAMAPGDGTQLEVLLKRADMALYQAKSGGRDRFHFFEKALDEQVRDRRLLEVDLHHAIDLGQFELLYQPIVSATDQSLIAVEALIRWNHPTKGMISPVDFIPLAEEAGLMVRIGDWVLREACEEAARWPSPIAVAVNISPLQFDHGSILPSVKRSLDESGLAPQRLEIEITESTLLHNSDLTLVTLQALRHMGVRIALDDFGTGFNSLNYLRCFTFDKIKIDQSFIRDESVVSNAIIRAVARLGHRLGLAIVAEGVENEKQLLASKRAGCTEIQGYYVSRPVSAKKLPVKKIGEAYYLAA